MIKKNILLPLICLLAILNGCSSKMMDTVKSTGKKVPATQRPYVIEHRTYYPIPTAEGYSEKGIASWYGKRFHGRKTANGETYNMYGHTAAHKTLPMNTMLLVKNLNNGKSTVVRINDRGPFVRGRIIDLTHTAAKELDILRNGTAKVEIVALGEEIKETPKQKVEVASLEKNSNKKIQQQKVKASKSKKLKYQDFDKGNFYIQVGAFEHKENAKKLAQTFARKGHNVIIQQFPAAGIRLYRVMVYSGTSLKLAKKHEVELEKNGFPNALVIARDKG